MGKSIREREVADTFAGCRIGGARRRTEYLALRHGRDRNWSADDLFAAQQWANVEHYPGGFAAGTAAARFADRTPIELAERDKLCAAIVEYERQLNTDACIVGDVLTDTLLAAHHRRAVRKALVELGYLDITRRFIPQPLRINKCARIT